MLNTTLVLCKLQLTLLLYASSFIHTIHCIPREVKQPLTNTSSLAYLSCLNYFQIVKDSTWSAIPFSISSLTLLSFYTQFRSEIKMFGGKDETWLEIQNVENSRTLRGRTSNACYMCDEQVKMRMRDFVMMRGPSILIITTDRYVLFSSITMGCPVAAQQPPLQVSRSASFHLVSWNPGS